VAPRHSNSHFAAYLFTARLHVRASGTLSPAVFQLVGFETSGLRLYEICMQNLDAMALALSCIGTLCWIVCFWWMHRISSRQDTTLEELHEMTARIEKLSQAEHDLIRDVHPQVNEIKEKVENVREVVSSGRT
jgi:hypothetical protein